MTTYTEKIKNIFRSNIKAVVCTLLFLAVLFVSVPAFADVIYAGHDLWGLCGRIEGIKSAWDCGQIFPVVMPNANNGYGYLEFMYPELFLLIPAFLRHLGFSMVTALHVYIIIINTFTAVFTYFGVRSVLNDINLKKYSQNADNVITIEIISMVSALYFLMNQYRLLDIYIRAAIGEGVSMSFIVLAMAGMYHILCGNRKLWWMAVIGMSGILHSHILSCALIVPVVLIIGVFYIKNMITDSRWKEILLSVAVFFIVNAWYIIPFVKFYRFGLNTDALIVDDVWNHTARLMQLFSTSAKEMGQDYVLVTLGIPSLLILILALIGAVINYGTDNSSKSQYISFLIPVSVVLAVYLLGSLDIMPFLWVTTSIPRISGLLSMLQFPLRLLTIASACLVYVLAISLFKTGIYRKNIITISVVIVLFGCIGSGTLMEEYETYTVGLDKEATDFENNVPDDYLPAGIDKSIFEDTNVYFDCEDADYSFEKNGTDITITYNIAEPSTCSVPLLYYPCYAAEDENGSRIEIFQLPNKRIGLTLPAGEHTVHLKVKLY